MCCGLDAVWDAPQLSCSAASIISKSKLLLRCRLMLALLEKHQACRLLGHWASLRVRFKGADSEEYAG